MSAGEIVITCSIEKRSDTSAKPQLRETWKAEKGYHMVFLELGTLPFGNTDDALMAEVKRRLRLLGYVAENDKEELQKALALHDD